MFTDLKPYLEYRNAPVPWATRLPHHWQVRRGRTLFTRMNRQVRDDDGIVTCFRDGVVTLRSKRRTSGFTEALQEIGYQGIRTGDLVIHAMDAFAGAVGVSDSDGKGTPVYAVCRPLSGAEPHYFAAVVREMARSSWIAALSRGVRERSSDFRFETFAVQEMPVPPPYEQAAIVKYLGHANARIDRAIAAKRKLIALLEEQKLAVINQAVTRGHDPTVPLKDSGIPWLGQMPAHWNLVPARHLFRTARRRNRDGTEIKLSVTQKQGLVPTEVMVERSTQALNFDGFQVCLAGDLVLNKYKAHLGVFWAARSRGLITPNYTVFAPVRTLVTGYFEALFHTRQYCDAFGTIVYGVTEGMSPLYTKDFNALPVLLPPLDEQAEIVEFAASLDSEQGDPRLRLKAEILLLREFRTRLTADVVTGQLDIRDAAARLPELDPVELGGELVRDEDELDAELAESLEEVDA